MLDLSTFPLAGLFAAFAAAALVVWWAGARLPAIAAAVGEKTGIGQAFAGMLLLGGITTLPEFATTTSAAAFGAERLALNNIFGSAAFNLILLAFADAVLGRRALTSVIGRPATLLQGVLGIALLGAAGAAAVAGDVALGPAGLASTLLFLLCIAAMRIASQYEARPAWQVVDPEPRAEADEERKAAGTARSLAAHLGLVALLILAAGFVLSQTAEEIALRTGLGSGLVGLLLLALATSLPKLTAITAAVRGGHYEMAVGDVFGANLFNIAMIFVIDLASPGGPVLAAAGRFEAFAALLGLTLTSIFVVGLIERKDRTVARFGYDSAAALIVYAAGVTVLATVLG